MAAYLARMLAWDERPAGHPDEMGSWVDEMAASPDEMAAWEGRIRVRDFDASRSRDRGCRGCLS
jgi:hypothetical protein